MPWKEIDISNETDTLDFVRVQQLCSNFYAQNFTVDYAKQRYFASQSNGNPVRAFIYRDGGTNEMNLATSVDSDGVSLQLQTLGVGKTPSVMTAIGIVIPKITLLAGEYGLAKLHARWPTVEPVIVRTFYLTCANSFANYGWTNIVITNPRADCYDLRADLPIPVI